MRIGYHASHEQFPPEEMLDIARRAEAAGFEAMMSSDHFKPWSETQGHSGFVWSWLGAAMQATGLRFGTMAIPGGWRYHPAIVAQAAATLARMFPGRLAWLALGSGEALNESIVGKGWPDKAERNERLREGARIIRDLWDGKTVSSEGPIAVRDARIYSLPTEPRPKLFGAALTPATAEWLGGWADGFATVAMPRDRLRAVVEAFRATAGEEAPMALQMHLSWAPTEAEARELAVRHWRYNVVAPEYVENLPCPEAFEDKTAEFTAEDLEGSVVMTADPERLVEAIVDAAELGFDELYLHHVGPQQREFLDLFAAEIAPRLPDGIRTAQPAG